GADDSLFPVAFRFYRPHYFGRASVDRRNIVRTVIIGEDALRAWFVIDAIWSFADIDFLYELQGGGIEHRNLVLSPITGKSVLEFRDNYSTVHAWRVGNRPHHFPIISIHHIYLRAMRKIEPPRGAVDSDVVKPSRTG